jgi:putative SOS response-associated peptidase YedK
MCGRYVSRRSPDELAKEFAVQHVAIDDPIGPDYNVAPGKQVYAILERARDGEIRRQLRTLRWGLVPSWTKDPKTARKSINARIETAAEKPSFRQAFARRRAILPADGYYEWHNKQPYYLHPGDGGVLAMAGLYELWHDPDLPREDPAGWLWTTVVLTTEATDDVGHLHDRAPLVVPRAEYDIWLSPEVSDTEELRGLLVPATANAVADRVSTTVNNVRNNGPELTTPIDGNR